MKELFEVERCKNCQRLKADHYDKVLRTDPDVLMCPRTGMFSFQQMTPLELGEWIEEQYANQ